MNKDAPSAGQVVGRYELITRLAVGGMAEIWLARERGLAGLERMVVIKRILPHLLHEPDFVQMFLREARIIARLNHPNVVQIHELGEDQGNYFLALEYIQGVTLRELQILSRRDNHAIPLHVALTVVSEACRGAHAAHELTDVDGTPLGLVHRDISPHNLMVTRSGHVKLLDFGVAKAAEGLEATSSGNLKGKYAYMSPEQCMHQPLDRRSDVFALGILLWELLAGRRLFDQTTELDILNAVAKQDALPVEVANPDVPAAVAAVVAKALARNRDARWESAAELRRALGDAARRADVPIDTDRLGAFVNRLAGEHLDRRGEILDRAGQGGATINSVDVARLTRVTTSHEGIDSDDMTVAARPSATTGSRSREELANSLIRPPSSGSLPRVSGSNSAVEAAVERRSSIELETIKRRWPLLLSALLAGVLCAGLAVWLFRIGTDADGDESGESEPAVVLEGEPIVIAFAPTVDVEVLREELSPLIAYLERETHRPIELEFASDYADLAERVVSGEAAYGMFPPLLYVRTSTTHTDLELVAVKEFDGALTSDGYLLVRHGDRVGGVADLEGKRICLTDPESTTGNFLPRAYFTRKGVDVETWFTGIHWSGSHLQVMRDLLAGECDVAATYNGAYLTASNYGVANGQLRMLAITGNIPQDVIVAGATAATEDTAALREALIAFDPEAETGERQLGANQRITGFAAAPTSLFEDLREMVASGGSVVE